MSTDTTGACNAHPAAAPAIPNFDPSNEAHQRLWQLACEFSEFGDQSSIKGTEDTPEAPALASQTLFSAYVCAKARYDLALYSDGVSDVIADAASNAHGEALNDYLLAPADDLRELARKLKVFRDEQIHDNWCRGQEIVEVLAADAHRFAYDRDARPEAVASRAI